MELYGSLIANEGSGGGGGGGTVDVPIKSISVNGSGVAPMNKNVNIDVPTKTSELQNDSNFASTGDIPTKTSQLENDSSFVTESDLTAKNYADKTYVEEQIAQSEHLKRKIVTVLPEPSVADEHTIYMLKDDSIQGNDKYKEYMLIEGVVQCVGDTSVDLTDYAKTADIPTELPANGGNADTVNNHTVESDVPVDAKFTDTVYDDTEVKESINDVNKSLSVIGKCKNLLNPTLQTTTRNGITCTDNGDGTYTLNGTATSATGFIIQDIIYKAGVTYKLVGCPKGGSESTYRLSSDWGAKPHDYGSGTNIKYSDEHKTKIGIYFSSGTTFNNLVFKPMLTTNLDATYDDFVPYTGDSETLTEDVAEIKNDLGGLTLSASGTTLSITDGTNTWTLEANN